MDNLRKGDMVPLTKREALACNICPECNSFLKTHKMLRKKPDVYIGSEYKCKKCKMMFEILNKNRTPTDKIVNIWKIV